MIHHMMNHANNNLNKSFIIKGYFLMKRSKVSSILLLVCLCLNKVEINSAISISGLNYHTIATYLKNSVK